LVVIEISERWVFFPVENEKAVYSIQRAADHRDRMKKILFFAVKKVTPVFYGCVFADTYSVRRLGLAERHDKEVKK
jgi:hypothetical protein